MFKYSTSEEQAWLSFASSDTVDISSLHKDSQLGLVITDLKGQFIAVNQPFAEMLGYAPEELVGMTIRDVTSPSSYAESFDAISVVLSNGGPVRIEKRYRHRDGSEVRGETHINGLLSADGNTGYMCTIVENLSKIYADLDTP